MKVTRYCDDNLPSPIKNYFGATVGSLRLAVWPPLSFTELSKLLKTQGVILSPTTVKRIEYAERNLLDYELAAFLKVFGLTTGKLMCFYNRPQSIRRFSLVRRL